MKITDPGFQDFRAGRQLHDPAAVADRREVRRLPADPAARPGHRTAAAAAGDPRRRTGRRPAACCRSRTTAAAVDPDLINDIQTLPYAQRFRLIFNELGATLAGRGNDIEEAVKRANPDLRDADRLLEILADQRDELAQLASDSEQILRPLAARARRTSPASSPTPAPPARRPPNAAPNSKRRCSKFPQFLREFRTTMRSLQGFSDAATPVFEDLDRATPALTEATRNLGPFTAASTVALKALGNAGEASGPMFRAADPVVKKARNLARTGASPTTKLAKFLVSTKKTEGLGRPRRPDLQRHRRAQRVRPVRPPRSAAW